MAAGTRNWDWGHVVANLDAQVSAVLGTGVGGCGAILDTVVPEMCLVPQGSEMKYALKRLITGLGVGRETARPCYSLALAQVRW